jgi:hypothetical protein
MGANEQRRKTREALRKELRRMLFHIGRELDTMDAATLIMGETHRILDALNEFETTGGEPVEKGKLA